ncbi:hypothetical protein CASFOL_018420 [Castilleja foliolosa]|uniref:Uncharacterized protein n=1 Tax=Castilleja foliolosa TaxID=1961234 RepID=A0ABD3D8H0_9LAMI
MVRQSAAAYGHDLGELTLHLMWIKVDNNTTTISRSNVNPLDLYFMLRKLTQLIWTECHRTHCDFVINENIPVYHFDFVPLETSEERLAKGSPLSDFVGRSELITEIIPTTERKTGNTLHLWRVTIMDDRFTIELPPSPKKLRSSLETTEESCLALRYEALVMREEKSTIHPGLPVTCKEWLTLVEYLLENGFNSIANHACEKALMCTKANHVSHAKMDDLSCDVHSINKIMRLKDVAMLAISSQSVQAQTQSYLKQKVVEQYTQHLVTSLEAQSSGSSRFRNGIIKHNLRKLNAYQCP